MSINLATLCNTRTLTELSGLLHYVNDAIYQKQSSDPQGETVSSIGAHCRHIIEFYQCFFHGLPEESIDYDARQRAPLIEHNRSCALRQLNDICEQLHLLAQSDLSKTLMLKAQIDKDFSVVICETSIVRELVFLQSHSIHHMATISVLLNNYGVVTPKDFGLADATRIFNQKHHQEALDTID